MALFFKEDDTFEFDVQAVRELYGRVRLIVDNLIEYFDGKVARNELTAPETARYVDLKAQARALDTEVRVILDNPGVEIDRERIVEVLRVIAKIIGALL